MVIQVSLLEYVIYVFAPMALFGVGVFFMMGDYKNRMKNMTGHLQGSWKWRQ